MPEWAGRAGMLGRGALFVVVGWLALAIAFGDHSEPADQRGALAFVARQPVGRMLVLMLAVLFAAYAAYRVLEATLDPEDVGTPKRLLYGFRGLVYASFSVAAATIALSRRASAGNADHQQGLTAALLGFPGGRYAVAAVALGLVGAGGYRGWQVVTGRFADDLKCHEMPRGVEPVLKVVGSIGELARMVAFALVGAFLVHAAWTFDPNAPIGLDESLRRTAAEPWGPLALIVVGLGLIAYGVFAIGRARYERVLGR